MVQDSLAVTTNARGIGEISLPPGRYEIVVSRIGFRKVRRVVFLRESPVLLQIFLSPVVIEMPGVVQRARRRVLVDGPRNSRRDGCYFRSFAGVRTRRWL